MVPSVRAFSLAFVSLVFLLAAGDRSAISAETRPKVTKPSPSAAKRDGPESILRQGDLPDFAARLERSLNTILPALARNVAAKPVSGEFQAEFKVTIRGEQGNMQADGLIFPSPWPARFEAALLMDRYQAKPAHSGALDRNLGKTELRRKSALVHYLNDPELNIKAALGRYRTNPSHAIKGALQVNFVYDDRADPPSSYALFRGVIEELGPHRGRYTVHGEMQDNDLTSLVTGRGGARLARPYGGREPREFLTYVSTVTGTGKPGNQDGEARAAQFNKPAGVFADHKGRLFVADTGNHAVREITPTGEVSTISSAFQDPWDLGMDGIGLLVVSDRAQSLPDGGGSINHVVTDGVLKGTVIRLVGKAGYPPNSAFGLCPITAGYCDGRTPMAQMTWVGGIDVHGGLILATQWAWSSVRAITPDGMVMTLKSWGSGCGPNQLGGAYDVARGNRGEVYFTSGCNIVNVVQPDGTWQVLAGKLGHALGFKDGRGEEARFSYPAGLVFDGENHLFLTESTNSLIRRVDTRTGDVVRVAGCLSHTEGFDCNDPFGFRDGPGDYALFHGPENLSMDRWGDLYVADTSNHAVRMIRIIADPDRLPSVTRIQPLAVQKGAKTTVTVTGRSLGLTREVNLGPGVKAEVKQRGFRRLKLAVEVAEDAEPGPRRLSLSTPFGKASTPDGMTLKVMTQKASKAQVKTIAGTGKWSPGVNDLIPAEMAEFAFPGGLAAIDKDRLLIADPLEQRIRMIATKEGAAREILELAAYQAGGQLGLMILEGAGVIEDIAGGIAGMFGGKASDVELMKAVEAALDKICEAAKSKCEYMALPWAGLPMAPGDSGGFRLNARLFLPTDVAVMGEGQFLIADSGNTMVKTVGLDISGDKPKPAPYQVSRMHRLQDYPLAVKDTGSDTAVASTAAASTLGKVTLRNEGSVHSDFAGVRKAFRCARKDGDVRHPMGLPMGIARGKPGTFVADPYCKTLWRLDENGEVEDIHGNLKLDLNPLPPCSDGPLVFATFGAPMDVAVDSKGNLWVADAGCHSVRLITDKFEESGLAGTARDLGSWAKDINYFLESDSLASFEQWSKNPNLGVFDAARWWVKTIAGNPDGEPGFKDGPASEARFNAPVSIAVTEDDGKTFVYVSDVGNKRIRMIKIDGAP